MIVREKGKWYVKSHKTGKKLGGPYGSEAAALHRLRQIQYFKHKGK